MEVLHTYKSPNYGERRSGHEQPSMIIIHYTDMETGQAALERLCDPKAEVSAHYVIEENGDIYQLVDEVHRAWHAGASAWKGETDINSASIGVELVNPGHSHGYRPFPDEQIEALIALSRDIVARYQIPIENILGHEDVAPGRKQDPGPLFPWEKLRNTLSDDT